LSGDYERVSAVAHKKKPSIDNLKIESLQKPVRQIENDARERVNLDDISSAIDLLQQTINKVVVQMQPHLND
jgi:HPt (histidine-containing phosphotransfer) domain-containing protein